MKPNCVERLRLPWRLVTLIAALFLSGLSQAQEVWQFTLNNGMTLIAKADPRAPTAVHMLWLRVGSMDEVDGYTGVAHVLEHMLFKGTPSVKPGDFSRQVAALGGRENAFTNKDYTGYYQQIPANRLPDVMRLEADRFANNQWPDAEFLREIEVVKEERRMRTDDSPRMLLYEQLNAAQFVASPYRRPVIGWMNDLDSMTPQDARDFYQRWYLPRNTAVVVVGDVDVDQVKRWADEFYGVILDRPVPARKPRLEPAQSGTRRIQVKAPADQAYLTMSWKVPGFTAFDAQADNQDALALTMLAAVLDGYRGARLDRTLAQGDDRLADSVGASHTFSGRGPQVFMLDGVPAKGRSVEQLETALREQIAEIARDGVNEAEMKRVRAQWLASTIYQRDSLFNQARELGTYWVEGLPLDSPDRLVEALVAVTPQHVQAVAQKYFVDEQLTVATLLPQTGPRPAMRKPVPGARHSEGAR
ncbi:MAG: insulinase family protein [Limnohabitans sp.]|nr:insulinase family protein [Limnohabitans sp.]